MKKNKAKDTKQSAKPFLKWAGGKRQLLDVFQDIYPKALKEGKVKNYYEPFLGGGAVFFDIAQRFPIKKAYLYDINPELVLTYKVIQKNVEKLIGFLERYDEEYKKLEERDRKDYYYDLRSSFNHQRFNIDYKNFSEEWISRAAQIIFLNKTCYNGLFRFNLKGGFNSPMGRYKNPTIVDQPNLLKVAKLLQKAVIRNVDFRMIEKDIDKDSGFVYFDPPYRPISRTSSFTAYSKFSFNDEEQQELAKLFRKLDKKGHLLMLSNSDPKNKNPVDDFFDKLYADYTISRVDAKRSINSKAANRKAIKEIIVTNY